MAEFYPYNFGGLSKNFSDLTSSKYVILSIPYEATTTFGKGTKKGPSAIIEASRNMELFDEETFSSGFLSGIHTTEDLLFEDINPEKMVETVYSAAKEFISKGKFLISLGGEHSISFPLFKAHQDLYDEIGVLQVDAHLDLRESYEGSPNSHASVMKRIYDNCQNIVQVGIRSLSEEEGNFIKNYNGKIFWAREISKNLDWIDEVVKSLPKKVYLTFDVDGLDPSIMPATGTPEPGGLFYYDTLKMLKKVVEEKDIVGADFVELSPIAGQPSSDFLVSKL
ncbi:MAG: agmatinase, partial [Thermoanaerobaculaceae bacterium]|nr:agmatinase [Thermoanaerobaculaceae bacterium]